MTPIRRSIACLIAASVVLLGLSTPLADQPRRPSISRLARLLAGLETLGFSGAVIVEHRGRIVHRAAYGMADREARRAYEPETVQTHGSITKQITAAAILLLEARGKLSVGDPLAKHLAGVPTDKLPITLHHLLTHTSGLPGGIGPDDEPIDAATFVTRAMAEPLAFEPGGEFTYSNVGYALLGIVVERVSGRGYEAFVRDELLRPAGMRSTGYLVPSWGTDPTRLAVGYAGGERWGTVHRRGWRADGPGWHLRGNGGLHTTVDDMHRWLRVLQGDGPLPAAAIEKWTTAHVLEDPDDTAGYGYGWEVSRTEFGRLIAHNGGNGVFSADFVWLPDAELFVYVQGNSSLVEAAGLREMMLRALFDRGFRLPPAIAPNPDVTGDDAATLTGEYLVDGGTFGVTADGPRLLLRPEGQSTLDRTLRVGEGERAAAIHARQSAAEMIVRRLRERRDDALAGMVGDDENALERVQPLLRRLRPGSTLEPLGTVDVAPGARFADVARWASYVRLVHENDGRARTWSLMWRADGTYLGTAIGPPSDLPTFVLVAGAAGRWEAVEREPPWRRFTVRIGDGCLEIGGAPACRATHTQAAFFERLRALCGARFEGGVDYATEAGDSFRGKPLVATIAECGERTIRIPFAVGDDRSRTWILTRRGSALELKHDHRHADGTPDEVTMYGGTTASAGTALTQSFPADAATAAMIPAASTNVWRVTLAADGGALTYDLMRDDAPRFRTVMRRAR